MTAAPARGRTPAPWRDAIALLRDNPVLEKDAGQILRRPLMAIAAPLLGAAVCALVPFIARVAVEDGRTWGALAPVGAPLFLAVVGALLAGTALFVPLLGALAVAGERDRGTLPLLVVSGLSPGRIIAGKVGAVVVVALPAVALALPVLGVAVAWRGVEVVDVVLAVAAVLAHLVAQAAVGVWASAVTARLRGALVLGVVASGAPALLGALPIFGWAVAVGEGDGETMGSLALTGVLALVVLALAALHGAWSTLAPRRAPRTGRARALLVAAAAGVPWVGAFTVAGAADGPGHADERFGVFFVALWLGVGGIAAFVGAAGDDPRGPTPRAAGLFALAVALLGSCALFVASFPFADQRGTDVLAYGAALVVAGTGLVAAGARRVQHRAAPFALAAVTFAVAFCFPAFLDEVTVGSPPLACLNPAYAVDEEGAAELGVALWIAVGALGLLAAGGHRPRPGPTGAAPRPS